jgi:hypothetical protein
MNRLLLNFLRSQRFSILPLAETRTRNMQSKPFPTNVYFNPEISTLSDEQPKNSKSVEIVRRRNTVNENRGLKSHMLLRDILKAS